MLLCTAGHSALHSLYTAEFVAMLGITCHWTHHHNAIDVQEASAAQTITMLKDEMDELTALVEAGPAADEEAMLAGLLKEKDTLLRERDTQVLDPSEADLDLFLELMQLDHIRCFFRTIL